MGWGENESITAEPLSEWLVGEMRYIETARRELGIKLVEASGEMAIRATVYDNEK